MVGDVQAEHLALGGEQDGLVPLAVRDVRARSRASGRRPARSPPPNRSYCPIGLGALGLEHGVDRLGVHEHEATTGVSEGVEGAGLDQRLDGALVADDRVDLGEEVGEVGEAALVAPRRDDRGSTTLAADVADRGEAEADVLAARGEVGVGLVDVGRQDLDAHAPALTEIERGLVLVVLDAGEQGGHVFGRIVRLEIGGPVGDDAIAGAVRLVEAVVGERDEGVPQGLDRVGAVAVAAACRR